jgi:predicted nucleic acid-binding protein
MSVITLLDTNILIDLAVAGPWQTWSAAAFTHVLEAGGVAINPVIFCELAKNYHRAEDLEAAYPRETFQRLDLPWNACFIAGQAHLRYREAGGRRDRTLPDFLIGAHASVSGLTLATRDAHRYRSYFPELRLIEPGTHHRELVPEGG